MKNISFKISILAIVTLLCVYCKKSEDAGLPVLSSSAVAEAGDKYAIGKAEIESHGGSAITAKGFCWNTVPSPTLQNKYNSISLRDSLGQYTGEITPLLPNTKYYVRAYATNANGTIYGEEISFTTTGSCPVVTSLPVTDVTKASAKAGVEITNENGSAIIAKGLCWGTSATPAISVDSYTDGIANPATLNQITGLQPNTIYYVRAYAKNANGTGYGKTIKFCSNVVDIDGNEYKTVIIGTQVWLAENLKVTRFRNGESIPEVKDSAAWVNSKSAAYCNYNNDPAIAAVYGRLYNWYAATDTRKVAPQGWHVPSEGEFKTLVNSIGGTNIQAALMEIGTIHWNAPNDKATNNSGFTALPSGSRGKSFGGLHEGTLYWTTTTSSQTSSLNGGTKVYLIIDQFITDCYFDISVPLVGNPLRCVRDNML